MSSGWSPNPNWVQTIVSTFFDGTRSAAPHGDEQDKQERPQRRNVLVIAPVCPVPALDLQSVGPLLRRHEDRRPALSHHLARRRRHDRRRSIDQTLLPHGFVIRDCRRLEDAEKAIRTMVVRGAPLIGVTAAYGMALAMADDPSDAGARARPTTLLLATRPTAVNLRWALDDLRALLAPLPRPSARDGGLPARRRDLRRGCRDLPRIGEHGLAVIRRRRAAQRRRADQRPHPLQRRLAGDGRLGHRAGADLPGARGRHPDPCLGRRDAAAQPGRQPDRLGARPARRAAHRDRRQRRRPPDAARARSTSASSAPTARRGAATSATRSAPT